MTADGTVALNLRRVSDSRPHLRSRCCVRLPGLAWTSGCYLGASTPARPRGCAARLISGPATPAPTSLRTPTVPQASRPYCPASPAPAASSRCTGGSSGAGKWGCPRATAPSKAGFSNTRYRSSSQSSFCAGKALLVFCNAGMRLGS